MIAGMVPMALGMGEGGEQTAPLGRAVIGGLLAATFATLLVLPGMFALALSRKSAGSASIHPHDPQSSYYDPSTRRHAASWRNWARCIHTSPKRALTNRKRP